MSKKYLSWALIISSIVFGAYYGAKSTGINYMENTSGTNDNDLNEGEVLNSDIQNTGERVLSDNIVKEQHENIGSTNSSDKVTEIDDSDFQDQVLFKKALQIFSSAPDAEKIALHLSLYGTFSNDPRYGKLLHSSLEKIDRNINSNLSGIKNGLAQMKEEDSFLRGATLNMLNKLNLSKNQKIDMFGSESTRPITIDSLGNLSPDSINITTAMLFLKQSGATTEDALPFLEESLRGAKNSAVRGKILQRIKTYFPDAVQYIR